MEALWCVASMVMHVMSDVIVLTLGQKGLLAVTYTNSSHTTLNILDSAAGGMRSASRVSTRTPLS